MYIKTRSCAANYKRLKPYLLAADANGGYCHFTSGGFMPLSVERLWYSDYFGHPVYSITHHYTQNGDLMRDPDMTISVDDSSGTVCPLSYQQDGIGLYQEVFREGDGGRMMYSERLLHDLDAFLAQWSKNIIAQGFDAAQPFREKQSAQPSA